jgi:MFS family permease
MSTGTSVVETSASKPERPRKSGWLINRNFTLLSIGQAISNMGDFVYSTTLLIWVFALGGSAAAVSGVLAAQYAPMLILGPLAGVFVDRWQRLRTMLASDLTRAVIALLPLAAPGGLRLPAIYLSVFLISVISRFFQPARTALVQAIVAEEEQAQAAAIGQVTFALSIVTF